MPEQSPFASASDVVVEGLDQPLLTETDASRQGSIGEADRSVSGLDFDRKSAMGSRSITRIRSIPGRISSVRSLVRTCAAAQEYFEGSLM